MARESEIAPDGSSKDIEIKMDVAVRPFAPRLTIPPHVLPVRANASRHYICALAVVLVFPLTTCIAQATDPPPGWQSGKLNPEEAWVDLQRTSLAMIHSAPNDGTIQDRTRLVLKAFAEFAKLYSGSEQATLALITHGMLTAGLGDVEAADRSFQQALKEAKDPILQALIQSEIAKYSLRPDSMHRPITGKSLDGKTISTTQFKGKVLLLDFWATWCGPCVAVLPQLKRIYKQFHGQGFEILSISLDDDEQALRTFIQKENLNWTHILNSTMPLGQDAAGLYGVEGIPYNILIGRDGRIASRGLIGPQLEVAIHSEMTKPAKRLKPKTGGSQTSNRPKQAVLNQIAPALSIGEWIRGKPTSLDALKGKVVLLDIFQIICPGCHMAHPKIVQMMNRYQDQGLQVLGLAVAFEHQSVQAPEDIRRFVNDKAYPYPVAIDHQLTDTFRRYRAGGTPYAVLIDRAGRVRYLDFFRQDLLEPLIQQLLKEDPSS